MEADVFAEARRLVSAREVAVLNGFHPNRSGFICCPFHGEKTASLKLYENGSWYCFGCGRGGSSIDLVVALYGLTPLDAVRQLNEDFHLSLLMDQSPDEEMLKAACRRKEIARVHKQFEEWRKALISRLCEAYRVAHFALLDMEDLDKLTEQEAEAIRMQPRVDYWLDILSDGTPEDQMQIFRERQVIQSRIDQILNHTPKKSGAD